MAKKYEKTVLTKGYALTERTKKKKIINIFPKVNFFDENGDRLGSLSASKLAVLYRTFLEIWPEEKDSSLDLNDRKICDLSIIYEIWLLSGFIHIIDPNLEKTYDNSLAIMDKPAATSLSETIDKFV